MKFLDALQFLTIIPTPHTTREADSGKSVAYFPLVGLIIGLVLSGASWALAFILPAAVANVLIIVLLVVLTGAMHLDGLADTCDGIAGHKPVEERWRIMHDSRSGAFGIVGVALLLLVKYVSLNSLPAALTISVLLFMPVASRWAMVYAVFAFPYARPSGLGLAFKQGATWPRFAVATITAAVIAGLLMPVFHFAGLVTLVCLLLLATVLAIYFKGKFAGLTGDTYGAINEIGEVGVLIVFLILVKLGLA